MRIVMFGTGPFAVPTFKSLLDSEHEVLALFTRPIADSGNRRKTAENPTRDVAQAMDLPIHDRQDANDAGSIQILKELNADLFVVCDYGQILSRECLAMAQKGGINLHGSLLPKYRGAAPINWCLYHGDPVTGITIIHMTAKLDGGPCLAQRELAVAASDTAESIEPKLAELGVGAVDEAIAMLEHWDGTSSVGVVQDQSKATRAPRLKKSDGLIDWNRSAAAIRNQVLAFQPWPGTYTNWHSDTKKQPMRLIVHAATAMEGASDKVPVGCAVASTKEQLVIQTGTGQLAIDTVQPAGKKPMAIADFLRGNQPAIGDRFG